MKPILSAQIVLIKGNEVLLVKHGEAAGHLTGVYGLPGGKPIEGEEMIQTIIRELKEETGLSVSAQDLREYEGNRYTADIKRKSGETKRYTMRVFYTTEYTGDLKGSRETTPEWVPFKNLDMDGVLPNVKKAVLDVYMILNV